MITWSQRLISILFYILILPNLISYGNYFYTHFPLGGIVKFAIIPIIYIQNNFLLNDLVIFAILFLGIARNASIAYFIRFNAMQVVLLKLTVIIIKYIYILINNLQISYVLQESIGTTIFIGILTLLIFSIIQCLRGNQADLPFISEAAKMQI